jgi:glycosyltransferase involved in cell wall biosynthesis
MTIFFISIEFNYCCGISRSIFALSKELKKNGHRIILGCPNGTMVNDFTSDGFEHVYLPINQDDKKVQDMWRCLYSIKKTIKKNKVDIIHSHHRLAELYAVVAATFTRVATVSSAHALISGKKSLSFRSDHIIAISEVIKDMLTTSFRIDKMRISMIRNIPRTLVRPLPEVLENFKRQLELPEKSFIVAGIGRLHPEKGFDIFLKALRKLSHLKNIKAILVGKGDMEAQLKLYVQNNNLDVIFMNEMNEVELIYEVADLIIIPSRQESAGLVALEAAFFQKPVIATQVGGLSETIQDGFTGLLVSPESPTEFAMAIEKLYNDRELSKLLGQQLYSQVNKEYATTTIVQKMEAVYNNLISGNGRG